MKAIFGVILAGVLTVVSSIQAGYSLTIPSDKDTSIDDRIFPGDDRRNTNYGEFTSLYIQNYEMTVVYVLRTLISFDLSGFTSPVEKAVMKLTTAFVRQPEPTSLGVYAMTRSWVEGTASTVDADDDGASWMTYDGVNPWDTPGGDFDPNSYAWATVPAGGGPLYLLIEWDVTDLVNEWITGARANYGLALIQYETIPVEPATWNYITFFSGESGGGMYPVLDIVIPESFTITSLLAAIFGLFCKKRILKK